MGVGKTHNINLMKPITTTTTTKTEEKTVKEKKDQANKQFLDQPISQRD